MFVFTSFTRHGKIADYFNFPRGFNGNFSTKLSSLDFFLNISLPTSFDQYLLPPSHPSLSNLPGGAKQLEQVSSEVKWENSFFFYPFSPPKRMKHERASSFLYISPSSFMVLTFLNENVSCVFVPRFNVNLFYFLVFYCSLPSGHEIVEPKSSV